MLLGYALLLGFWYLSVEVLRLPRFADMPGPTAILREWLRATPTFGISIHTPVYYQHILISLQRVLIAFAFATLLGVPTGLLLGWSKAFRDYVFPLFEMLRPIPILAWVPLAIIMLPGSEMRGRTSNDCANRAAMQRILRRRRTSREGRGLGRARGRGAGWPRF
jgi:ABC-type nitrate/sulfonate/bicarbonate transport system permease component